jgi:hypothetical protein
MSKLELNPHKSVHNPDFAGRNITAAEIEKVTSPGEFKDKFSGYV